MGNGYKILWTDNALSELKETFDYLENFCTDKELNLLSKELDEKLKLISENPQIFTKSNIKDIRRVPVRKFNTLYYRENKANQTVEILSFFSNRQSPNKRKI